jgi:peptide deformylase
MSVVEIITEPNIILRNKSTEVDKISTVVKILVENMIDTLRTKPGVGIAAPQLGINKRIIVIESRGVERENGEINDILPLQVLINPTILKFSREKIEMEEGCFSIPNCFGPVERPKKIKVVALDLDGKKISINASGFLSRVIQHETDHLDGILFTDYIKDKSKIKIYKPDDREQ